jgi:hypothetical protein
MADDWLGISSTEYDSHCGDYSASYDLPDALDGSGVWLHYVNETHWFILDLGATYTIKKFRGRAKWPYDPVDVDIYVSDSKVDWGVAVATGISTWQDTVAWVEVDSTDKNGRYIKVEIIATEHAEYPYISWGGISPSFTIFDAYGDVAAAGVNCFMQPHGYLQAPQ